MKTKQLLLCAALTVAVGFPAFGGTSETVTFTATVPSVLALTTTSNVAGVTIVSSDYDLADAITSTSAAAHTLAVRSNRGWIVSAKSATANFAFTPAVAGDTRTKSAGDLSVRKASGAFQTLSTTNVTLASGTAGGVGQTGNTFAVDYQFASDITIDPPGSYVLDVVYTLTAP
jgi:hypothetical protein